MAFTIKIDGTEYPSHIIVKNGTLSMSVGENGKKVLNFELVDRSVNGTNYFTNSSLIGKKIELLENGVLKFGGQLDMPKLRKINLVKKNQKVACVDWNFLTEKKYVNKVYYKQPISDIIKKIIDEYLTPDGVYYNSSSINDVTNQLAINCSYSKCQSVLDEISNLIGYKWNIEDNKRFSFKPRNAS